MAERALSGAVREGDYEGIRKLLDEGTDANTLLVSVGACMCVMVLCVERGDDFDARFVLQSPEHRAAFGGSRSEPFDQRPCKCQFRIECDWSFFK